MKSFSKKSYNKLTVKKINKIFLALILSTSIFSCKTLNVPIPGEGEVVQQNLAAEYAHIAESYEKLKNYDSAVKYYQMSIDAGGNSSGLTYKMARCYALAQDWENARKMYAELLTLDPDNLNIKLSIAYIDAMSGDFEKALEEYRQLSEENPTDFSILKNYILVLMADGKYELAEQQFFLFKERFPDNSSTSEIETKMKEKLK